MILQHILHPEISLLSAQQLLLQVLHSSGPGPVEEMLLHSDREEFSQSPEQILLHKIRTSSMSGMQYLNYFFIFSFSALNDYYIRYNDYRYKYIGIVCVNTLCRPSFN